MTRVEWRDPGATAIRVDEDKFEILPTPSNKSHEQPVDGLLRRAPLIGTPAFAAH
jgi:hypothetical protein